MDIEQIVMNIIIHSGDARSYLYEALEYAKKEKYDEIGPLIEKANEAIGKAHEIQTQMLQEEASGNPLKVSILFVHSQDHLMTTISEKNMILEIIELRKVVNSIINKGCN
jgi:PTS system cellobiose-specific IIA component